ncbi:transcriptional activator Aro80p [Trichomonascus vanleenenianus]|uniref:transcriptional activator Aro80p n=1 Tax=Trichomonascus vanleenenianus TaxID=2268995 RepID=UPI003EC96B33
MSFKYPAAAAAPYQQDQPHQPPTAEGLPSYPSLNGGPINDHPMPVSQEGPDPVAGYDDEDNPPHDQQQPTSRAGKAKNQFRRSYKACLNCRDRKVRCDLGDLSNPYKPPCVRCRREGKECVFGVSRRGGVGNVRSGLQKKAALAAQTGEKIEDDLISGTELHNTSDALEILAHAARSFPRIGSGQMGASLANGTQNRINSTGSSVNHTRATSPSAKIKLADSDIVAKKKIISEDEAKLLIDYFFDTLHPFYPFIPEELRDPDSLAETPILLAAVTTLSSRYCKTVRPESHDSDEISIEIHGKLWDYCQTLISQTVWAEASTRSIGTVYAFLLFSEWNPRAIHQRWKDYANDPNVFDGTGGLSASRRSDRMAWMLIGTAIRLAQDLGLMESSSKVYLATHLSEIVLALRMGRRSMLGQSLNEPVPENLQFTKSEQAKIELLQIMSLAHETLYGSRKTTRELLKNGSYLTFLALFGPHLSSWERNYRDLLKTPSLDRESILFDYHYARLYIYSLAMSSSSDPSSGGAKVSEIIPASRYVGMATDAAKELLAGVNRVYEMGMLSKAPIRWIVRIVHATIFLVKSIMLSPASSLEQHKHSLFMIKRISQTLIEASPDNVHLCSRYGTILMTLFEQLVTKMGLTDSNARKPKPRRKSANAKPSPQENQPAQTDTAVASASENLTFYSPTSSSQVSPGGVGGNNTTQVPAGHPVQKAQPSQPMGHQPDNRTNRQDSVFEFSRYSFPMEGPSPQQLAQPQSEQDQGIVQGNNNQAQSQNYGVVPNDPNQNLLSMLDMEFDFLMEGTEGLGFVEPLMEGIEHQQLMQQRMQQ